MLTLLRHRLSLVTYALRSVGPAAMVRNALRWSSDAEARAVDSGFDARHGTDTNGDLTPTEAEIPTDRRAAATMYLPTMDQDLAAMLVALPWSEGLRRQATFVDLGSGKARVVLLAAMRRFRAVIGVELSPVLHDAAVRNVVRVQATGELVSPIRLIQGDATAFEAPSGPVIIYLYHPFTAPIAEVVVARLVASLAAAPRPAAILYGHPTLQPPFAPSVFAQGGVFDLAAEGARRTRRFRLGWSAWTNRSWLGAGPAVTAAAGGA